MTEPGDPRPQLRRAFDQTSRLIAGVSPQQFGQPTPCSEYDVSAMLNHVVGVGHRVASLGRREEQGPELVKVTGVADDGWPAEFESAQRSALDAWSDDTLLDEKLTLPWGTFPGAVIAQMYVLELTTHSWDLAKATNQTAALDPALAEMALAVAREVLPPEPRGGYIPFDPVVEVPDDAPPYDRLAGYLGRSV